MKISRARGASAASGLFTYLVHCLHGIFHLVQPALRTPDRDIGVVLISVHGLLFKCLSFTRGAANESLP